MADYRTLFSPSGRFDQWLGPNSQVGGACRLGQAGESLMSPLAQQGYELPTLAGPAAEM